MGQLVVLYGSLAEGLSVKGPYRNWGETIHAKKAIHDDLGCCVIEGLILTEDDAATGGEFVLVLGSVSEGYAVYGCYATAELAADANSPFRHDPINPHTSDGQRLGCILRLEPA
jgi:hypothetical protein